MNCFVCGKPAKGADYEDILSRSNSVSSFAASRTSTMSSSTHSQLRYSHSYSRNDTRKETIREKNSVLPGRDLCGHWKLL
ncbi:calmodulin-binding receptor-like cytoplasmic kinase 2 [Iris pallida]|uniref:Calmodulin-binding receptor-like cytoplasmic kinase 2 n=1 Tax=Iris pallida TaxID=29817 RepID=A0AAX6IIW0_IRIPA|nr:calmodulin-binding receptor-like cytoplasmic kinase 2 [Iris pallida]